MEALIFLYYRKYKSFIIPIAISLFTLLIFIQVFLNQLFSILDTRQKIETEKSALAELQTTLNFINSADDSVLENDLSVVNKSLPDAKDILSIYLGLMSASAKANITIDSFSFKIGNLYDKNTKAKSTSGVPELSASIKSSSANPENLARFPDALYKSLPLSDVKQMSLSKNTSLYDLVFYYKPYDLNILAKQEKLIL